MKDKIARNWKFECYLKGKLKNLKTKSRVERALEAEIPYFFKPVIHPHPKLHLSPYPTKSHDLFSPYVKAKNDFLCLLNYHEIHYKYNFHCIALRNTLKQVLSNNKTQSLYPLLSHSTRQKRNVLGKKSMVKKKGEISMAEVLLEPFKPLSFFIQRRKTTKKGIPPSFYLKNRDP